MGADFAIDVEPPELVVGDFAEDEIVAYYRASSPPGTPPLEAIRGHVVQAMARGRVVEPDPVDALHAMFVHRFGRDRLWWDPVLEVAALAAGVTPLARFQVDDLHWCTAEDGLRTVGALQVFLREQHPDRADQIACLEIIEQILVAAGHRHWRLLVFW